MDDDIVEALASQHAELAGLLDGLGEADWQRPSRCEGWTVADVVIHLDQSDRMALGALQGSFGAVIASLTEGLAPAASVDEGAELMVQRERGRPVEEVRAGWEQTTSALVAALRSADPSLRVDWVAGQLSARTLATTRLAEAWIHTGDIASGLGVPLPSAPTRLRHVARLAWRTLPYAFARAGKALSGPVAFHLAGSGGERWDFDPPASEGPASTTISGDAGELCLVAARRVDAGDTGLVGEGPDVADVLALVRTYA